MNKLHVYNTKTRSKELFEPLVPGKVGMYVCGITAYDYCHLGHARCYVAFDVICRYLKYLGYEVTHIQNITDLDDKLIARAREKDGDGSIKEKVADIARKFSDAYSEDMKKLNVLPADSYPTATGNILEMQEIYRRPDQEGNRLCSGRRCLFRGSRFFPGLRIALREKTRRSPGWRESRD